MRIIGGRAKGFPLSAPQGVQTRPTADRVREAIFNVLAPHIAEARVLDLFAGTGALGLEALSRGAQEAVFIEQNKRTFAILQKNIIKTGFNAQCQTYLGDCRQMVASLSGAFDIVFLDPPYNRGWLGMTIPALMKTGLLATYTVLVVETAAKNEEIFPAEGLILKKRSVYGDTAVLYYRQIKGEIGDGG